MTSRAANMLMLVLALWGAWAPCAMAKPVLFHRAAEPSDGYPVLQNPPPLVITDEGSINYTPTVIRGEGLTFTAENLPTGASINSSTGQVTGTLSTPGAWHALITATNSVGHDTIRQVVTVTSTTTTIDSSWLTANGPAPYLLPSANTTYVLDTDVTADGTAFVVGAANVTFDINGHDIDYDAATQIVLPNGGFETAGGSADLADDWDFTNGTHFQRTTRTQPYMWGDWMVVATGFTGTEYIQSDPISVGSESQAYSAGVITKGTVPGNSVTVTIREAGNESNILATGSSSDSARGFAARAAWQRSSGDPTSVVVRIAVTPTHSSQYVRLDFAWLRRAQNTGIWAAATATGAPIQLTASALNAELNDATNNFVLIDRAGGGSRSASPPAGWRPGSRLYHARSHGGGTPLSYCQKGAGIWIPSNRPG